jgi:hypothetical protein
MFSSPATVVLPSFLHQLRPHPHNPTVAQAYPSSLGPYNAIQIDNQVQSLEDLNLGGAG